MTIFKVNYVKEDLFNPGVDIVLGSEEFDNLAQVPIPVSKKLNTVFITKVFFTDPCTRWKVEYVIGLNPFLYEIKLSQKNITGDIYLSTTLATRNIRNASGILKKGTIVIVEYGHIYYVNSIRPSVGLAAFNPCSIQNGEMHKRRPAVVVSADDRSVKVIPLTSQKPDAHKFNTTIFELERASKENTIELSLEKPSFALCGMVQSVHFSRVLPPLSRDVKKGERHFFRNQAYPKHLSPNDMKALNKGLLKVIDFPDLLQKKEKYFHEMHSAKQENSRLSEQLDLTGKELLELKVRFQILAKLYMADENPDMDVVDTEIAIMREHQI